VTGQSCFGRFSGDEVHSKIIEGVERLAIVNAIVPFFPFTQGDQTVVAQKFLLQATDKLQAPFDRSNDKLIGDLHLQTLDDGQVCTTLAKNAYDPNSVQDLSTVR
jgi:hypothetical protein